MRVCAARRGDAKGTTDKTEPKELSVLCPDSPADTPPCSLRQFFSIGGEADSVIRGKKGPGGCTVKKTATALVIGVYAPPVSPGDCSVVVENLGDYLSGQGI